jgi:hypothetical protein
LKKEGLSFEDKKEGPAGSQDHLRNGFYGLNPVFEGPSGRK